MLLVLSVSSLAQAQPIGPPTLIDGNDASNVFRRLTIGQLRYAAPAVMVTVKFKLTETGLLDTLRLFRDDAIDVSADLHRIIKKEIMAFDGRWLPQQRGGRAEPSHWLVCHYYLINYGSKQNTPLRLRTRSYEAAYQREYALYECTKISSEGQERCAVPHLQDEETFTYPPAFLPTMAKTTVASK